MRYTTDSATGVPVRVYPGGASGAALLWAHGGGFVHGDLDMGEADWIASTLADRGHTVVTVDYRLADDTVCYPAPSDDLLAAWRWLDGHARELGARSLHIGGASAGGNLALGAALRLRDGDPLAGRSARPTSVLLAYPTLHAVQRPPSPELARLLTSLPEERRWGPDAVTSMYEGFLHGPVSEAAPYAVPGTMDAAGLPPVIIVASETDGLRASAQEYAEKLSAAGIPHDYVVEPGTLHGHVNRPEEPAAARTVERFAAWLDGHRD